MNIPFGKNDHIKIIKPIAEGMLAAKSLNAYLEIGIRSGACFNSIAPLATNAYAVDINDCFNRIKHNKNLNWNQMKSSDFLSNLGNDIKFDLVFIDGDHKHESSMSDFELALQHTNDNGIIILHDTYPPSDEFTSNSYCSDSYKTASSIREYHNNRCEIVTLPFYFGVSIVRKLDRQLLWMNEK